MPIQNTQIPPDSFINSGGALITRYKWQSSTVVILMVIALVASFIYPGLLLSSSHAAPPVGVKATASPGPTPKIGIPASAPVVPAAPGTITIWSQALDSCRRALNDSVFSLTGPGVNMTQGALPPGGIATSVLAFELTEFARG